MTKTSSSLLSWALSPRTALGAALAVALSAVPSGSVLALPAAAAQTPAQATAPGTGQTPDPTAPDAVPVAAPPPAHEWHPFSSSAIRIYMVDLQTVVVEGDVSRVQLAKVPLEGAAGDYSYNVETVELRCAAKQSRSTIEAEFGPDGAEKDRFEDVTEWEGYNPQGRDGYMATLVCGDQRATTTWPSIQAWVDAGRK